MELARLAGLDVRAMLAGQLSDEDWSRLTPGAVKLSETLDEASKGALSALVDRIDAAFNSQPTGVRS
jgi:hypothetical protein